MGRRVSWSCSKHGPCSLNSPMEIPGKPIILYSINDKKLIKRITLKDGTKTAHTLNSCGHRALCKGNTRDNAGWRARMRSDVAAKSDNKLRKFSLMETLIKKIFFFCYPFFSQARRGWLVSGDRARTRVYRNVCGVNGQRDTTRNTMRYIHVSNTIDRKKKL